MEKAGYSADKPLKIKVATRNIAIYRDPAVILIDQLKKIYIEGELEPIDTTVWYNKIQRKDYSVGMNLTGGGVDDPDTAFYENFHSASDRNYTAYKNAVLARITEEEVVQVAIDLINNDTHETRGTVSLKLPAGWNPPQNDSDSPRSMKKASSWGRLRKVTFWTPSRRFSWGVRKSPASM